MYVLLSLSPSLSLSCCQSIMYIYIFPSQSHSNIIQWQVKFSSTNLLMLCFSLNIRTKYWVLSCSVSHKIQQGSCLWSTLETNFSNFFHTCNFVEFDYVNWSFHWFHSVGVQNCISCTQTDKKCVHVSICVDQICYKWLWFINCNCKSSRWSLQKL